MIGRSHGLVAFIPLASFPCLISTFALHTSQKLLICGVFPGLGTTPGNFSLDLEQKTSLLTNNPL
jgi:hypothetical protein